MPKPVLTIGMIVKNEIRCLERCLKALQPLRDAVPCELIIADTGSDDGTREIAEKYADLVFDFPWINDFSAARNAVLDRAGGEWFLSVDADEYLDDSTELAAYLKNPGAALYDLCGIIIRNYASADLTGVFSDFMAIRMARMAAGLRYRGAIHEMWATEGDVQVFGLRKTVFHHDGYVGFGGKSERAKAKQKRNMDLLKKALEKDPGSLKTLMQCVDSSAGSDEYMRYIRDAVKGVEEKRPGWDRIGPPIFRSAVNAANAKQLEEFREWVREAEELFPDSLYTRLSINRAVLNAAFSDKDYPEVIRRGEIYFRAMEDYNAGNFNAAELCAGTLDICPEYEDSVRIFTADSYFHEKRYEEARDTILRADGSRLDPSQASNYIGILFNLHAQSGLDMRPYIVDFWEKIGSETPRKGWGMLRRNAVMTQSARAYTPAFREEEERNNFRHAYTLFLPLKGECELGTAAAVLETEDTEELENLLSLVQRWEDFPIPAFSHALRRGVRFPLPGKPLKMEEMDVLAIHLAENQEDVSEAFQMSDGDSGVQTLAWKKALVMSAVRNCKWEDAEQGMNLARTLAEVEREFLRFSYTEEALQKENLCILPPLHRFGWYCSQAFDALEHGDAAGYARHLREGLTSCESMKDMVEFLLEHTPELQIPEPKPSGELMELAGKVRVMLSAYAPDDPAVAAIKASPVYRKVATLIEGPDLMLVGGLKQ